MKSLFISTGPFHILCANHGFHLCIMDVAYKIVAKNEENIVEEDSENDEEHNEESDEENEENFDYLATETSELIPELKVLIQIVRKHVKFFKYSPVRNDDFLQPEMLNYYRKFKKLSSVWIIKQGGPLLKEC